MLLSFLITLSSLSSSPGWSQSEGGYRLKIIWKQELASFSLADLKALKTVSRLEKDPTSQKVVEWRGFLLSELVDKVMKSLTPERKAQIDLIVLKNEAGKQALVPRAFLGKYPVLLAWDVDHGQLLTRGPVISVPPWTSRPNLNREGFSVESFFVPGVSQIEFANAQERYQAFFLKRRTDPAAIRGEKLFVQSCVTCHSAGPGQSIRDLSAEKHSRALASTGHPKVSGLPNLGEKERKSLVSYLEAFRSENATVSSDQSHAAAH